MLDSGGLLPPEILKIERLGTGGTNGVEGAEAPEISLMLPKEGEHKLMNSDSSPNLDFN